MVPFANAAIGRPDGASITDKVSTRSTYNSFEVCRTLALRHGRVGVLELEEPRDDMPERAFEEITGLLEVNPGFLYTAINNFTTE